VHAIRAQLDAVIALALQLALRRAEIRALDVNTAAFDNAYVMIGDWNTGDHREVPFTSAARDSVRRWCDTRAWLRPTSESLWLNTRAAPTAQLPMTAQTFNRLLHTHVGRGWELRRLRDTCAAAWVRAGMPLEHLRQLLGLARIEDTLPYARLVGGSLEGRMAKLDELFTDLVVVRDEAPVAG
jgi:site-specific recombinase XerD